ncbi:MAG: pyridinium-3,5-biscarboxylic acid mononucleotide sulfurtransferase [Frankiaceae bacterium]|nr:pyridinium-3,5-biscarboxylic acid mononucleotide sulfurtransferase [Frankiaceae bacterium]
MDRLSGQLRSYGRLIVAFSGGADSALLAFAATDVLGSAAVAVTAISPSLPESERVAAAGFAQRHGIAHLQLRTDEDTRAAYLANGADRCYHCKSALLDALDPLAAMLGAPIAIGTIVDDLGDHRPGQRAASERGVVTPLVAAGFTKDDVRRVSAALGLETAAKPAAACVASRVAYGEPVSRELLESIATAEEGVRALGFPVCRVRAHGGLTVARLELPADDIDRAMGMRDQVEAAIAAAGFQFVSIDLHGFASGRMNVMLGLPAPARRPA